MQEEPIKILLVLPFLYPHRGGSQKYAEEIFVRIMKNHSNVKVDVLCYNTDKVKTFEEYRGFRIYRVPCWNVIPARFALADPFALICKLKQLSANKYDFVNTHIRFFDPTWWIWLYAKIIHAKSIFTGHVATHPVHQNKIVEFIAKVVDLTIAKVSLKFYDYILFTNKTAQKFFQDKLGVKKKSTVVYGGVDTTFFIPTINPEERIIPNTNILVDQNITLITYVGRMIWTKGVTYFLDAALNILKSLNNTNVIFVLAGPGELENQLRKQIEEAGLSKKIIMTGDLSYDQVRKLMTISDIFVSPSHHNEGFPNTVLEAGSSGCYVIATDNAGTWEVIENGKTGALIPQKDLESLTKAILWAVENPDKRKEIAINLRQKLVEEFDWNKISEQLYQLLLEKA